MTTTLLAVNGTLMRGLELNPNMQKAGGIFVREDRTDAHYRLWSINERTRWAGNWQNQTCRW